MQPPYIQLRDTFLRQHPAQSFTANGRRWSGISLGTSGPALVLLPGTLGRADIFWQQFEALKGRARVLALSYPDSGTLTDWAADVLAIMAAEGFEKPILLGSSLGGYLAQYIAATNADKISGLVAANTLPSVMGIDQIPPYSLDLDTTPIEDLRAMFTAGLTQWKTPAHPYAALADLLLQEVSGRISEGEMRARLRALKYAPEIPALSLDKADISIVESEDDHLISEGMRAGLRAKLGAGRVFEMGTASHFPYVTRPERYTAMLEDLLNLQ